MFKSLISSAYLLCCLNSIDYTDYVYGTTRLKLTQENTNKIMIPVPPLNEQNRISKAIDMLSTRSIDAALENKKPIHGSSVKSIVPPFSK